MDTDGLHLKRKEGRNDMNDLKRREAVTNGMSELSRTEGSNE